jgi:hypothetical protein
VAHLLIQDTDTLVGAVLDDAALDVAGNSARQLLSGLRLPTPVTGPDGHCTATGPIEALPTLTGQLVDGPAPDPNRPSDTAFALTMRVNPGTGWITLAGPTVAEPGDAGGMAALPPELVPYNPAAAGDPAAAVRDDPAHRRRRGAPLQLHQRPAPRELPCSAAERGARVRPGPAADRRHRPGHLRAQPQDPPADPGAAPDPRRPGPAHRERDLLAVPESLLARARADAATRYELVRAGRHGTGEPADTVLDATFAALLLPPAPVTVAASLGPGLGTFAAPVFALATTLRLTRPGGLVDPAFRAPAGDRPAQLADAAVPAPAEAQGRSGAATLTLAAFAAAFHAAFPDLRLGTARADAESGGGRAADLWVVDFRKEKGIAQVAAGPPVPMPDGTRAPRYFALRPLYPGPVTRLGVDVRALLDGSLSPGTTPVDFQGLDTEVLARRLIADVDLFLGAGYAPGVYADPAARGALGLVLAARRVLSAAIARGLDPVLTAEDQYMQAGKAEAVAALRQELAADLSRAYDTAVVVQYAATVDSPWTRGAALPPARLYGTAQPVGGTGEAQALPYTLSAARTVLDRPLSSVTFLMRVPDPGYHGAIPIDLDYNLLDLQFGIRPVTGGPGFEDSSWLAFYPPLAGPAKPAAVQTRLGAARVPVPLSAYPAPPSLIGQSARPTAAGPRPSVADTRLWTYSLTYSHEHAEQDEVLVTARFNVPPERSAASAPPDDVAVALMRYNTVADGLWELLAYYAGSAGVPAETAARAAGSFANLVSGVAEQWTRHWPAAADLEQQQTDSEPVVGAGAGADTRTDTGSGTDAPPRDPVPSRYDFRVRVGYATDPAGVVLLDTVTLSGLGSGPVDPAIWPAVSCRAPGGRDILLEPQVPVGVSRTYRVPAADRIPAGEPPVLTLGWAGLPVALYQNARAELPVRRNQELLGAGGPATCDAFVFRTALTQAPAPVTPTLSWAEPIDISELGGTLAAALASAFTQLSLPSAGLVAAVSLSSAARRSAAQTQRRSSPSACPSHSRLASS